MNAPSEVAVAEVQPNPFKGGSVVAAPSGAVAEAAIQREIAEVQAAVVMAKRFPRDQVKAMDRILQACMRPSLAEVASYQYSRGGSDISGPSIRLAEAIAQNWGNIISGVTLLSSDGGKSECIAYAWDLETNCRDEKRFTVRHWRDTKKGGYAITDERDIYELAANLAARRKRACILAVIPGDVVEAAERQADITLKAKLEITDEFLQTLVEAFGKHGITKEMIEKRIQRRIDTMTPALAMQLKKIHNSLRDGMSSAADWFEMAPPDNGNGEPAPKPGNESVKAALRKRQATTDLDVTRDIPGQGAPPSLSDIRKLMSAEKWDDARALAAGMEAGDRDAMLREIDAAEKRVGGK